MNTIEIDILNEKALMLLQDLEQLKLIRIRRGEPQQKKVPSMKEYKGAMEKQSLKEIDNQLNKLRNSWE